MKASVGFIFFLLFLAGIAFINLKGMKARTDTIIRTSTDIAGTAWRPTHIGEMRLPDDTPMNVHFDSATGIAGHAGCNRFSGEYGLSDGLLSVSRLGTTRMACPEPVNSYEISFLGALQSAQSLSRAETRLAMRDGKDNVVARFVAIEPPASER